ncbi:MAG TPA: phage holin family protein [Cytophagaceae bacterium]|jgi:putative membrane protein|nr:phage holin family protein [Cytophagaceae bacterium]
MKKLLIKLLFNLLVVLLAGRLLSFVQIDTWQTALVVVLVLSVLNVSLKPILTILTIPITIFTLGFFLLVINALMILLTDYLVTGFNVHGFWAAFLFGLILSIANMIVDSVLEKK